MNVTTQQTVLRYLKRQYPTSWRRYAKQMTLFDDVTRAKPSRDRRGRIKNLGAPPSSQSLEAWTADDETARPRNVRGRWTSKTQRENPSQKKLFAANPQFRPGQTRTINNKVYVLNDNYRWTGPVEPPQTQRSGIEERTGYVGMGHALDHAYKMGAETPDMQPPPIDLVHYINGKPVSDAQYSAWKDAYEQGQQSSKSREQYERHRSDEYNRSHITDVVLEYLQATYPTRWQSYISAENGRKEKEGEPLRYDSQMMLWTEEDERKHPRGEGGKWTSKEGGTASRPAPQEVPVQPTSDTTSESNEDLVAKYQAGDHQAGQQVILQNQGLVYKLARKYANNPQQVEDYVSDGTIGLYKAMDSYDPDKGKFTTHAFNKIRGEITGDLRKSVRQSTREGSRPVKDDEVALLADIAEDESMKTADTQMSDKESVQALSEAMEHLNDQERQVINHWFGLEGLKKGMKGPEIAKRLGVSKQRVSSIKQSALEKLKKYLPSSFDYAKRQSLESLLERMRDWQNGVSDNANWMNV